MYATISHLRKKSRTRDTPPSEKKMDLYTRKNYSGLQDSAECHPSYIIIIRQLASVNLERPVDVNPKIAVKNNMKALSFKGFNISPNEDYLKSRKVLFVNNDIQIGLAAPLTFSKSYFYKNADADEMIFIHQGTGNLRTAYGNINFKYGDYLIIPRGTIYQIDFDSTQNRLLIVESFSPILTPKQYRNNLGQLLEHSPFC